MNNWASFFQQFVQPEQILHSILTILKIPDSKINELVSESLSTKNFIELIKYLKDYSYPKASTISLNDTGKNEIL